jgi:pimeloyl-ACP methyl ester carboxylesterase
MLPGFGGHADQPILVQLDQALCRVGLSATRVALPPGRPSPGLEREVAMAREIAGADPTVVAYAGRSFGGRVLARLAVESSPRALVLLGFPLRSATGTRRPEDEAVLARLTCPTLVVQGAADPLGPVRMLKRLSARNPRLELEVIAGASHAFGRGQRQAVETAASWLARVLGAR